MSKVGLFFMQLAGSSCYLLLSLTSDFQALQMSLLINGICQGVAVDLRNVCSVHFEKNKVHFHCNVEATEWHTAIFASTTGLFVMSVFVLSS